MHLSIGSLSNDDGNGTKNGNKLICLDWQNNNFAHASRFFVHFFAIIAQLQHEKVFSRTGTQNNNFLFLFLNLDTIL